MATLGVGFRFDIRVNELTHLFEGYYSTFHGVPTEGGGRKYFRGSESRSILFGLCHAKGPFFWKAVTASEAIAGKGTATS